VEELNSYEPGRLEKWVFTSIALPGGGGGIFTQILTMPGISVRLQYLKAMLFPSKNYMLWRYDITNPKLLPLYYLRRQKEIFSSLRGLFSLHRK
jgi:hypothetical protein